MTEQHLDCRDCALRDGCEHAVIRLLCPGPCPWRAEEETLPEKESGEKTGGARSGASGEPAGI